ncbi:MAG: ABC transporter ATP-binding protein [Chloroflexota bacterium]|nr:ABC transporter ATP-binding protein [Chloroflexota bacterium]MDE2907754.1 ABC transporter ATP-binding protein [Chloroflexota bacterium]
MMSDSQNLLEFDNVTMSFGGNKRNPAGVVALENFNLTIRDDEPKIIAIAGESGSGKTTLARLGLAMIKPTGGGVIYRGQDLWAMSNQQRRDYRRDVQAIFQDPFAVYNPFYTIDRLLLTPIRSFKLAKNRAYARQLMEEALDKVGLRAGEVLGRYPHQLSGGQRQRIVVARSLLLQPKIIVADEPVSMIDASLRANILTKLKELRDDFGISLLYITHDLATAHQISDQIFILYRGRVVEVGDATTVIRNPQHPYTQLLVSSIPRPDPERRWEGTVEIPLEELSPGDDRAGCLFRHRCPHAMAECEATPGDYAGGYGQTVACYLYKDNGAPAPYL